MVDINQWRASIGGWNCCRSSCRVLNNKVKTNPTITDSVTILGGPATLSLVLVLALLLVLSGDIELNPGPGLEPDPSDVFSFLRHASSKWEEIGLALNVGFNIRESIRSQGLMTTSSSKLEAVIHHWIESRCSEVSWDNLIKVLCEILLFSTAKEIQTSLLNNERMKEKYRWVKVTTEIHPLPKVDHSLRIQVTVSELHKALDYLFEWEIFAIHLPRISSSVIMKIVKDYRHLDMQKLHLCMLWVDRYPDASWSDVVQALQKSGNHVLAEKIAARYSLIQDTSATSSVDSNSMGYDNAVRQAKLQGEAEVVYCRVMLLGPGGVGKTSLKRGLMGHKYDSRMNSTIVADVLSVTPVATSDGEGPGGLEEMSEEESEEGGLLQIDGDGAMPLVIEKNWITDDWREVTDEDEINELARLIANVKKDKTASIVNIKLKPAQAQKSTSTSEDSTVSQIVDDSEIRPSISSTTSRGTSKFVSTIEVSMNMEILDKAFERAQAMESSKLKLLPFYHVWDCGGQPVFQEVLPMFLTAHTMFLILFNANESLRSPIELLHYRQGQRIHEEGFFNVTSLQLMKGWMSNIHSYLLKKDENGAYLGYPRVIPIGTRGDKLTENEKKKVKDDLFSFLKEKAFRNVLKRPAIVDNTTAGSKGNEDPAYSKIRRTIYDFAMENLVEMMPITWVLFRKVLNLNLMAKRNTITLEEAKDIGSRVCKVKPDDVEHVLKFYHELGVLLYYPYIKGLEDTIILNPIWFLKCLGLILTLPGIDQEEEFQMRREWELLRTKGILVQPLYASVWKRIKGVNPSNLIDLLERFQFSSSKS